MVLENNSIAFIGGGHITEIIASNLKNANKALPKQLVVSDPDKKKLNRLHKKYDIFMAKDNLDAVSKGDFVLINVPPQAVNKVLKELSQDVFPASKVIVTLAAGIPINKYDVLGKNVPVARALPNPPSQIGRGITALAFNIHVTEPQRKDIVEFFTLLGDTIILNEENINAATALSSPAITYLFFQSLIDAGIRAGIDHKMATKIVYQTIIGALELWSHRGVSPYELIREASTPGGVSVESLFALDRYAFRAAINEAIYKGTLKAAELSRS
jgi:pyrroline-5-carboxylate reductase